MGNSKKINTDDLRDAGAKPENEQKVRLHFRDYFKSNKSKITFGKKIETLYEWLTQGKLTLRDKALIVGALLYFINPLDLIPDITPFIGFTDDFGVVYLVYNYLQNRSLEDIRPGEDDK